MVHVYAQCVLKLLQNKEFVLDLGKNLAECWKLTEDKTL